MPFKSIVYRRYLGVLSAGGGIPEYIVHWMYSGVYLPTQGFGSIPGSEEAFRRQLEGSVYGRRQCLEEALGPLFRRRRFRGGSSKRRLKRPGQGNQEQ